MADRPPQPPPPPPGGGDDQPSPDRFRWLYGQEAQGGVDPDNTQRLPSVGDWSGPPAARGPQPAPRRVAPQPAPPADLPPPNLPPPSRRAAAPSASPSPAGRRPPRAPRRRRWWLRIPGILLLVWLLFLIAVPLWGWSRIDTVDAEPDGDRPGDQPGTTYLIVGSDSREGLDAEQRKELSTGKAEGNRTDTIMLLHVGDGQPVLLSIPRDSPVDIPDRGSGKINSAFSGDGGGPELLVETVEQSTGIRVDDYIEIGFGGFVDIVDGLGGVEICPKDAIRDPKAGLDVKKGCQEADGATALGYARTRKFAIADLERVQNQREVITAIGSKAASPWTVINPWRYLQVVGSGTSSLTIGENVGPISLGRFGWNLARVTGGSGLSCTVPNTTTSTSLQWDAERADRLFELIATDETDDIGKALCTQSGQ